jgi:calcineurin-like phosphoesterase family protein
MKPKQYLANKIFFIADLHLGHANIIDYMNRPFKDIIDMENQIVANWNNKVRPSDTVFVPGDFCWKERDLVRIRARLNGHIIHIRGNHCKGYTKNNIPIWDRLEIRVIDPDMDKGYQCIIIDHYPLARWNHQDYGSWMIHGHTHRSYVNPGASYDVGEIYTPISYSELKKAIFHKVNTPNFTYGQKVNGGDIKKFNDDRVLEEKKVNNVQKVIEEIKTDHQEHMLGKPKKVADLVKEVEVAIKNNKLKKKSLYSRILQKMGL